MNIHSFVDRLHEFRDREAIIYKNNTYTYGDIVDAFHNWLKYFEEIGLRPGEVVAIDKDYSLLTCSALLALAANANIIVLFNAISEEEKATYINIAQCSRQLQIDGEALGNIKYKNSVENELLKRLISEGKPGIVFFTSGSTGQHKGVVHDLTMFLKKYEVSKAPYRTLAFLLLDHIGGINTLLHTLSSGGTLIVSEHRTPDHICRLVEKHCIEILPTTPTFLNLLLVSERYKEYDLSSLKIISYGTEVMPEALLLRLNEIFPNVKLKQTYGLSELGIMSSKSESSSSLWMKIGGDGFKIKVVDGILHIKADSAMLGYINAPSPFDEDGWFNTQDHVLVKGEYIKVLGRASEIINVGGEKVYPAEVENMIIQISNIKGVIVKAESNPLIGNIVVARVNLIEPESSISVKNRIRAYCKGKLENYKIPVKVEIVNEELFNARFKKIRK